MTRKILEVQNLLHRCGTTGNGCSPPRNFLGWAPKRHEPKKTKPVNKHLLEPEDETWKKIQGLSTLSFSL